MRKVLLYATLLAVAAGCRGPREIPRNDLKEVFKDAFLVNAYYQSSPRVMQAMRMDSLDIYRPILERHGYTLRDLEYTVREISKQKSRNLSDVVELSIAELKRESEMLDGRVAALDSVDARAGRMFMQRVLFEERIAAEKVGDTSKLRITVPLRTGTYEVSYRYLVDSLEENGPLRIAGTIIDTAGRWRPAFSQSLSRFTRQSPAPQSFAATPADSALTITLGNYPVRDMKRPGLTVDSLRVIYFLPRERALDSLMRTFFHPYTTLSHDATQNSIPLRPNPVGTDAVGSSDAL